MSPIKKYFGKQEAEPVVVQQVDTKDHSQHVDQDIDEKVSVDHQHAAALGLDYVPGSPAEKKLLRKLDFRLLPCCWVLYILGYLDRSNIGNAKTAGMQDDFNITSNQYSIIVLIFFVSYTIFEIPSNMVLVRVKPSIYLSSLAVLWGVIVCSTAATKSWQGVAGCRFALGAAEAGFAAGCAFYLSSWYRSHELAARFAVIYTSVALAGGLSGLLAGVITEYMDGARGIPGWKWLFLIEGAVSGFAGVIVWFFLPDYPSVATKFLTEEERILACHRLALDGIGLSQGAHERMSNKKAFMLCVRDWRVWAFTFLFMLVCGAQTMQYFIPSLVEAFGWEGAQAQYHTIPGYMVGVVCILAFSFIADYIKNKWAVLGVVSGVCTVLFIAVTAADGQMARYVLAIFAFGIIYGCSPLVKTWSAEIVRYPAEKRAISIALINSLGNASSIYGSWLWPDSDAPKYRMGFGVTTSWMGLLCICGLLFAWLFRKYPQESPDAADVIAAEIRRNREATGGREKA